MTRAEERDLIERALTGDRAAAGELVRLHQASLYAYILRISGRPDVAEDIVQDAFVRALTNLERFDTKFRFSTWLFTIAKRLYVNASQKYRPSYDSDMVEAREGRGGATGRPEFRTIASEVQDNAAAALEHALASLPIEQREIVVLFYQLEWPISQIADYLAMPEGTVKSHLHRSRRRMRELLSEHGVHADRVQEVWS